MQVKVTLRYDGKLDPNHGPVTHTTDDKVTWASVMRCGSYTELTLIADDGAVDIARAMAKLYAAEVGLPPTPASVDVVPLQTATA